MSYLLEELKRRNVFRVGAAYLVVGWIIVQIVETVSDPLALPAWTQAFFIVLLLAGFPVALIFAWAFEITPEGVKKTKEVAVEESVTATTGRKLNNAIIAALVLALGYFIFERQVLVDDIAIDKSTTEETAATLTAMGTSIAVLPFVDMSSEQDQEYFSDGIAEELLNVLAKIPDLQVAARTSSFQFKGQNLDIAQVAKQLNVDHVLEGSVRKANTRVRITAQLIEADTGYHMWSETYDRELTDIFGIQDEISTAIVAALSETLGLTSAVAPRVTAAANTDAYNAYLLGQHLIKQRTKSTIEASLTHFERAIDLDPNYAPAHASLALASNLLLASRATYGTLTLEESLSVSLPHIERALELDPNLADAHAVKGLMLVAEQKHEQAVPYFKNALRLNPSHIDVRSWYSNSLDRLGLYEEAFQVIEDAYHLDPLSHLSFSNYANQLRSRRRFDELKAVTDRFEAIDPARAAIISGFALSQQGRVADGLIVQFHGIDRAPDNLRLQAFAAFGLANVGLRDEAILLWPYPDPEDEFVDTFDFERQLQIAQEKFQDESGDPAALEDLAWAYFVSGDREQALKLAERYLSQLGEIRRRIDGANGIFIYDAWQRKDEEVLQRYIAPLKADLTRQLQAGIDEWGIHWDLAVYAYMQGATEDALALVKQAFSRGAPPYDVIEWDYEILGWNELPGFVEMKAEYDAYVESQRRILLETACGEVGFSTWKPLEGNCKAIDGV